MPLPADFNTGHVHGEYMRLDGSKVTGSRSVTFTPKNVPRFVDPPEPPKLYGIVIVTTPLTIDLDDSSGTDTIDVDLPATNDQDIAPAFTYSVKENFDGGRTYEIELPVGSTVDLSAVI